MQPPADIQRTIDAKNERAARYRQKCDRVWLIVIATSEAPSQFIEPSPEALGHTFTAAFEKVFFFESFYRRVHELRVRALDVANPSLPSN